MTVIVIDGPAGAGKSSLGRAAAQALGFRYVDTGAMYRGVTAAGLDRRLDPRDEPALAALARSLEVAPDGTVWVGGRDLTPRLREPDVDAHVSTVAAHREVRAALMNLQRSIVAGGRVVMEGRDLGTSVAPAADLKIWLTASLAERALRRSRDLELDRDHPGVAGVQAALARRDQADSGRAVSPLAQPDDAIVIDTTSKTPDEVLRELLDMVAPAR